MTGAPYLPGFGRCGIPPRRIGSFLYCNESPTPCTVSGRGPWNPTSAKTGQIWGTRHLLLVESGRSVRPVAGLKSLCKNSDSTPAQLAFLITADVYISRLDARRTIEVLF